MDWEKLATRLRWLPPGAAQAVELALRRIPAVQEKIETEYDELLGDLEGALKPYREEFPAITSLPEQGWDRERVLELLEALRDREARRWQAGFASGAVYHGGAEHIEFLNQAYALHSQSNPLHADLWPSAVKFEAEIVAMTAQMLGSAQMPGSAQRGEICGTVTSGGTESILLAMKTYRDRARAERGIRRPEIVAPVTAHAAFDKAAQYFGMKLVQIPVDAYFRANPRAVKKAINRNTVVVVGSAPSFPHGVIDPIPELSELARSQRVPFHTDACLGGFILPFAAGLGYPVPSFDFRLPGVTSISVDTHKYGYAAKGTSVILYRSPELRRWQFYTAAEWPGGLYFSPTFAGSRPGALSAAAWAALVSMGVDGYREAARAILETAGWIKAQVRQIPDLRLMGDSLFVVACESDWLNIYQVFEWMTRRGWSLNGLHRPPALHLAITLRHTEPGVKERFVADLREAVAWARANPQAREGLAPVYGLAASLPLRGLVAELLKRYMDVLYRV